MNNDLDYQLGRVVYSRSGRDAGRCFVVVCQLEEGFVGIADGCIRKLANPKKKKLKHVQLIKQKDSDLAEKIEKNLFISNEEIKYAIKQIKTSAK